MNFRSGSSRGMQIASSARQKYLTYRTKLLRRSELTLCATSGREHMQQSTGHDAPKQTPRGKALQSLPDHQSPDHSTCTRNQSLWVGNDVASPATERRWSIAFRDFMIVAQDLAYQPGGRVTRFV